MAFPVHRRPLSMQLVPGTDGAKNFFAVDDLLERNLLRHVAAHQAALIDIERFSCDNCGLAAAAWRIIARTPLKCRDRDRAASHPGERQGRTKPNPVQHVCHGGFRQSGYGWHLVFVDAIEPGRVPTFEEVEPDVKSAWLDERQREIKRIAFEAMHARYTV